MHIDGDAHFHLTMECAQKALQRLPEASCSTYTAARSALQERFEPSSRRTRYQAEFQTRQKRGSEGRADFADDLKFLVEKGFPELQEEAKELLAINAYLEQLNQPQVVFSVRQRSPRTLDEAVSATLEIESYNSTWTAGLLSVASVGRGSTDNNVATGEQDTLMRLVERLTERETAENLMESTWGLDTGQRDWRSAWLEARRTGLGARRLEQESEECIRGDSSRLVPVGERSCRPTCFCLYFWDFSFPCMACRSFCSNLDCRSHGHARKAPKQATNFTNV